MFSATIVAPVRSAGLPDAQATEDAGAEVLVKDPVCEESLRTSHRRHALRQLSMDDEPLVGNNLDTPDMLAEDGWLCGGSLLPPTGAPSD